MPLCSKGGLCFVFLTLRCVPKPFPLCHSMVGQICTVSNGPVYAPSVHSLQVPRRGDPGFLSSVFSSGRHKAADEDATVINDHAGGARHQVWPECPLGWNLWKTGDLRNGEAGTGLMNRPQRHHRDGDPDLCLLITAVLCLFVTSLPTVLPTCTLAPGCVSSPLSNAS